MKITKGLLRVVSLLSILMLSGCSSLVVTYPDGKTMEVSKLWGRAIETSYEDKESKKEYKANTKALVQIPEINLLKIPLGK